MRVASPPSHTSAGQRRRPPRFIGPPARQPAQRHSQRHSQRRGLGLLRIDPAPMPIERQPAWDSSAGNAKFDANLRSFFGANGHVTIDAIAKSDGARLAKEIRRLGGQEVKRADRVVSARSPIERLEDLRASEELRFARASHAFGYVQHPVGPIVTTQALTHEDLAELPPPISTRPTVRP